MAVHFSLRVNCCESFLSLKTLLWKSSIYLKHVPFMVSLFSLVPQDLAVRSMLPG